MKAHNQRRLILLGTVLIDMIIIFTLMKILRG